MSESILLIEDDSQIRKLLRITLQSNGYKVIEAEKGKTGLLFAANHNPDYILLDLGLPDENGQDVLIKLREWFTKPIIILSVQNEESDIVNALDHGANDYLTKPYRTGELLARIRSAMRKSNEEKNSLIQKYGDLEIDFGLRIVKKKNVLIKLTATEYELLSLFIQNEGRVMTHEYILKNIWGIGHKDQSQYLRVFIAQLRKKIEDNFNKPKYIQTESGVGYRFIGDKIS